MHSVSCICYCCPLLIFIASSLSSLQRLPAPNFSKAMSTLSCPVLIHADPLGEAQHVMIMSYCATGALLLPIFKIFSCLWGLLPLQCLSFSHILWSSLLSRSSCFDCPPALFIQLYFLLSHVTKSGQSGQKWDLAIFGSQRLPKCDLLCSHLPIFVGQMLRIQWKMLKVEYGKERWK